MAESVVTFLLKELSRVLKEEINLQRGVKQDIELIKAELEAINAFLSVADAEEEKDRPLAVWIKQVRDVAFDIEDILDAFSLHFVNWGSRFKFLNKIASFYKNRKVNHQIGSELESIKTRVIEIHERHQRYPSLLGRGSSSRLTNVEAINQFRRNALLVDESQLVGTEEPKRKLIDWLIQDDSHLKVLAVTGMGGLGKTTLVQQIYKNDKVKERFDIKALVAVSQSLNQEELLRELFYQLVKATDPQSLKQEEHARELIRQIGAKDVHRLKEEMKDLLQDRNYLIVLDDVWKAEDWDQLKVAIPRNNIGSRVIITTRITEVAKYSTTEYQGKVHQMQSLSESDSWTLFCKKTFQAKSCPSHLEPICRDIIRKCGGVPLTISTIAGLLATKGVENVDAWKMILDSLGDGLQENPQLKMMERIFSLSFHDLPYYLKSCFLYLSIFPEDYLIERTRLVRMWIAEGFVEEKDGRTLEKVAESYFYELLNRSVIQAVETTIDGRVKSCRIHDFLRETILSKSKDENFVHVLSKENAAKLPEGSRRLSILYLVDMSQLRSSLLSKLRSLFFFKAGSNSIMLELLSGNFKLLKVLDLQGAPLDTCPEQVSTLFLLRYLSLRNTKVSRLNKPIGNLHNLETLDLRQTYVIELPSEIYKLHKLRHLLMSNSFTDGIYMIKFTKDHNGLAIGGFKASTEIGRIVSLQKLCYLDASEEGDDLILELGKLVQLRRLGITNLKGQHGSTLCCSISKMQHLSSLTLHVNRVETIDLQGMSSPPPLLKRLYLSGHLVALPSWVSSLRSLEILHLIYSQLKENSFESLHSLPSLIELTLFFTFTPNVMMIIPPGLFPRVKALRFICNNQLLIYPAALPHLEYTNLIGGEENHLNRTIVQGYVRDDITLRWMSAEEWYIYTKVKYADIVKPRT